MNTLKSKKVYIPIIFTTTLRVETRSFKQTYTLRKDIKSTCLTLIEPISDIYIHIYINKNSKNYVEI